ncbi:MAG TPA: hypothetical protein RMH85_16170 [Polyangiaceae bacterium LLY-WYZ-15_(1-7)]|nr:hypothetical protein [Sandaracinus sp.]HJL01187.1 hypothetical protein [Polyangiaceae bacterium LLY-WYZ-15_(1-7)]MBJ71098.1 hypothetical protein [Sandaracinus sp.]HJL10038.1 hypothetical protein [Polyangiaceae bacterium LLY-WYZ-15_(1-7)]HJL20949.1 hypothetical protein [Polyangiaceae bacterium LLY-WYZ-15_(1-7)]
MTKLRAALLAALATAVLAPPTAEAQRPAQQLSVAAQQMRVQLEQRGRRGPLYREVLQLEQMAQRVWQRRGRRGRPGRAAARLERQYRQTRAAVHRAVGLDEALLDTWDEVVFAARNLHGRPWIGQPTPQPHPPQPPPVVAATWSFEGRFERLPVRIQAQSRDQLHQQCLRFARGSRVSHVDDIVVFGARHRNGPGFWDADALCSIAALNARASQAFGMRVTGDVEGLPFSLQGPRPEIERALQTYLPRALRGMTTIDDVTIDGRRYHNGPGFWNAQQVLQMILSQLPAGGGPVVQPATYGGGVIWEAQGDVEGSPFRLQAQSRPQLQQQCLQFVQASGLHHVDDITVNGQRYHNGPGFWDAQGICNLISSQARQSQVRTF